MTKMSRAISRFVVALSWTLATAVGMPGHGVLGEGSSLARGAAGVRLMHNGVIALIYVNVSRSRPSGFGGLDLSVINPDGTGLRRLTRPCTVSRCTIDAYVWSPNGRRIAFLRGHEGGVTTPSDLFLFVVNANGTGETRLARCGGDCGKDYASGLSWSPDGTRIAFSRARSLYVVNASTGKVRALTHCSSACFDLMPAWSPDGARVAFVRNWSLYIVNADGSGLRRLPQLGTASDPAWSPDGHRIAFDGRDMVYTMNADGSHRRLLVSGGTQGSGPGLPSWSPDGTHIVYASTPRSGAHFSLEVWVMNANGTGRRRLYHSACCTGGPGYPIWSPDGKYIAFDADINLYPQSRPSGIYLIDADGRHLRRLTQFSSVIAWQPIR